MNTRKLTISSLLLAVGLALHYIIPGVLGSMKPDTLLAMMFIAILICDDYKSTLAIGLAAGVLTAVTTTFPGGQLPNMIDKFVTAHVVFMLIRIFKNFNPTVKMFIVAIIGTLVSGTVFLTSALLIVGLPAPFVVLFLGVVLPALIANTILSIFIYGIVNLAIKSTSYNITKGTNS